MTAIQKESGYVFEVLPDRSVAFRRDDMRKVEALDALATLLSAYFGFECFVSDLEELLSQSPRNWRYLVIEKLREEKNSGFRLRQTDREPGEDSGENPVVTHVRMVPRYTH